MHEQADSSCSCCFRASAKGGAHAERACGEGFTYYPPPWFAVTPHATFCTLPAFQLVLTTSLNVKFRASGPNAYPPPAQPSGVFAPKGQPAGLPPSIPQGE